ncbi:redoxin domain-containing protein, partial [Salmonella enterica subsp. enterica serovar Cerro]|nr:redoxin domain-containing protein [Salmonella enterica subsp. enterica serovar Cerro]
AFKNGEFIEVTEKDTEGRWSVFFFYPADFTFVCPTELGDVADLSMILKTGMDCQKYPWVYFPSSSRTPAVTALICQQPYKTRGDT